MGFKSHSDYVAQGYSELMPLGDRASSLHLIHSLQIFTGPLTWPILGAWAMHWKGLVPSSLEPRPGVCCPQLSSQVTALMSGTTTVSLLLTGFSP